ncbi:MAG: formyltransferase family protein, partial [Leucobacter sp.]
MLKLAVLISGGGSNLQALIQATSDPEFPAQIVCVGADTDAAGLAYAAEAGIPHFVIRPK